MAELKLDDFALGETYEVEHDGGAHRLYLTAAEPLPHSRREGGGFRLEFRGPAAPILPQASYCLDCGGTPREIFIVPIGRDGEGTRYEAIFY